MIDFISANETIAPPDRRRIRSEQIGDALELAAHNPTLAGRSLGESIAHITEAIAHDHFRIYYNIHCDPVGYVTWTLLAPDVAHRMIHEPNFELHVSEWTEGSEPWIMDLVAPFGHTLSIIRELIASKVVSGATELRYVQRTAEGAFRRIGRLRTRTRPFG